MRRLLGVVIGFALFFPGALVLRWLVVDEFGIYQDMTLTDALLAIIIMLAGALLFGQPRKPLTAEELEEQARKMELASRRLEAAQKAHTDVLRSRRASVRPPARRPSGAAPRAKAAPSRSARSAPAQRRRTR